jgi:hypothetical protein
MPLVIILVALCWRIRRRRRFFAAFFSYVYIHMCASWPDDDTSDSMPKWTFISLPNSLRRFILLCVFLFFTSCCIPLISHNFVKWWERGCIFKRWCVVANKSRNIESSLHNHFDSRLQFCACVYSLGWAVIYSHAGQVEKYFFESSGPFFFFGRPSSSIAKIKADAEFRIKE